MNNPKTNYSTYSLWRGTQVAGLFYRQARKTSEIFEYCLANNKSHEQ